MRHGHPAGLKHAPNFFLGPKEVYEAGLLITDREAQAFYYGLWLTGARTSELAEIEINNIHPGPDGRQLILLNVKKQKEHTFREIPLILEPKDVLPSKLPYLDAFLKYQKLMYDNFIEFVISKEDLGGQAKVFSYWPNSRGQYLTPYDRITRGVKSVQPKVDIYIEQDGKRVPKSRPIRPHLLRHFKTSTLAELLPNKPLTVQQYRKDKSLETTLVYIRQRQGAILDDL